MREIVALDAPVISMMDLVDAPASSIAKIVLRVFSSIGLGNSLSPKHG